MSETLTPPSTRPFRNDIQGLRGVAIIAVLLFHFGFGGVDGGFLGVDIFFVISGFLITGILLRDANGNRGFSFVTFYAKRFWRIFPAYIVVIAATLGAGWLILLPDDLARLGRSAGFSSLFVSNFFFFKESGYFDLSGIFKPLLHTWSLAIEIQFYLLWPLLLLLPGLIKNQSLQSKLIIWLVVTLIASTALSIGDPKLAFFMIYSRLWEFSIGGWVALKIAKSDDQSPTIRSNIWGIGSLGLLIMSFFVIDNDLILPAPGAIIPVLATGLLIYLGAKSPLTYRVLSTPPLVWIGEISYSLYLVHWPLLVYLNYLLYPDPSALVRALALLATLPLAFLLYQFVEVPFRDRGKKQPFSPILAIPAITAFSAVLLICAVIINRNGIPSHFSQPASAAIANKQGQPDGNKENLNPNIETPTGPRLVLWGDSHSQHFKDEIKTQALRANYQFKAYYTSGCPPIDGLYLKRHSLSIPTGCFTKNQKALTAILADKQIDTVILAARWAYYADTRRFAGEAGGRAFLTRSKWDFVPIAQSRENFSTGLQKTLDQLTLAGKKVILLGQVPEFGFDPPRCIKMRIITKTSTDRCKISTSAMRKRQDYAEKTMKLLAAAHQMIRYVTTSKAFCNATTCSPVLDGEIAYRDDDHINILGAKHALRSLDLRPAVTQN